MASLGEGSRALLERKSHRLVRCWKVSPTLVSTSVLSPILVTEHNKPVTIYGDEYVPQGGVSASAFTNIADIGDSSNVELRGAFRSDKFTEQDLESGLWSSADIDTYVIDWRFPFQPILHNKMRLQSLDVSGDSWSAQLVRISALLRKKVGLIINRDCPYTLGDSDCKVNISAHKATGEVTSVSVERLDFDTDLTSQVDDYYQFGKLTWTSGLNTGSSVKVKLSRQTNMRIRLFLEAPTTISVGDEFDIYPGCGKLPEYCKGTSGDKGRPWTDNIDNHGGFPTITGADQQVRSQT